MEENILPDDMQELLAPEVEKTKSVQFARPEYFPPQSFPPQSFPPQSFPPQNFSPQNFSPQSFTPPPPQNNNNNGNGNNGNGNNNNNNGQTKKKNAFIKMSNNISKYPKCYLVLIIILILIILIIFIYYRGLLFLGPYCPNNVRSAKFKNRELQKDSMSSSKNKDDKLIQSLKL
jgi:hypothetical protein